MKAVHLRGHVCSALKSARQNWQSFVVSSIGNKAKVTCKRCLDDMERVPSGEEARQ